MKKYQGEDIYFSLNVSNTDGNTLTSFNDLVNIIAYAYTDPENPVKFSKTTKDGYEPLVDPTGDGLSLNASIPSVYTEDMEGQIIIDVMCLRTSTEGDDIENLIQRAMSGIFVLPSVIKAEL